MHRKEKNMDLMELRKLNFQKIIQVGVRDVGSYTFEDYRKNEYEHTPLKGYCVSCESKKINSSTEDDDYCLTNISHGAHSSDFFLALKEMYDISQWNQEPVVFIYESPSNVDNQIYTEVSFQGYTKHPAKKWYWIHKDQNPVKYPSRFSGGEYGGFVLSAILTFKLANVYITNLVKCGLNNREGKFRGLGYYKEDCIKNCYEQVLSKELDIIKPKVVFAVGSAVADWVRKLAKNVSFLQQLPHPAGRRRGFRDEHYKALYFWLTVRALHKTEILSTEEGSQLARTFLEQYDTT